MRAILLMTPEYHTIHPIPYAPDARASTAGLHLLPAFRALAAICRRRPDEQRALGLDRLGPGDRDPRSLADHGVHWIVLHRDIDPVVNENLLGWLERYLGPGEEVGEDVRWELLAPPRQPHQGQH